MSNQSGRVIGHEIKTWRTKKMTKVKPMSRKRQKEGFSKDLWNTVLTYYGVFTDDEFVDRKVEELAEYLDSMYGNKKKGKKK